MIHFYYHDGMERNSLFLAGAASRPVAENSCYPVWSSICYGITQIYIYMYKHTRVMAVLNTTRPTHVHRVMDMSSILFSWIANQENPVFQSQSEALFPYLSKQPVTEDGETVRRENTGTHRNRERLCLAGLLSKSFQSQKPINTLSSFTPLTLFIYQQALVKRTRFFLASFICVKEACPQHLCTHTDSKGSQWCV